MFYNHFKACWRYSRTKIIDIWNSNWIWKIFIISWIILLIMNIMIIFVVFFSIVKYRCLNLPFLHFLYINWFILYYWLISIKMIINDFSHDTLIEMFVICKLKNLILKKKKKKEKYLKSLSYAFQCINMKWFLHFANSNSILLSFFIVLK